MAWAEMISLWRTGVQRCLWSTRTPAAGPHIKLLRRSLASAQVPKATRWSLSSSITTSWQRDDTLSSCPHLPRIEVATLCAVHVITRDWNHKARVLSHPGLVRFMQRFAVPYQQDKWSRPAVACSRPRLSRQPPSCCPAQELSASHRGAAASLSRKAAQHLKSELR